MNKQEPGKRIVSKGEYATRIIQKMGLQCGSLSLLLFSVIGFFVMMCCLVVGCMFIADYMRGWNHIVAGLIAFLIAVTLGALSYLLWQAANRAIVAAGLIAPCLPLTRANTADLPAIESLVRASAEPLQIQQNVLLRAATQSEQTPPEQLVRPAKDNL